MSSDPRSEGSAPVSGPAHLHDRVAVVTGAAGGLGCAIARRLAEAGADVALLDRADLDTVVRAVEDAGRKAWAVPVDLADRGSTRAAVADVLQTAGRVDILVNNAGLVSTEPISTTTDEEWDRVLAVNLTAAFVTTQAVWDSMLSSGGGKLVYIGSRAARVGGNNAGPAYVASKGGLQALVVSAAKEGAPHGILSNGVMPGPIRTPMTELASYADERTVTPLGRMGRPVDIAEAVLYLASPASNFVTGTVLNVSGGLLYG